MITVVKIKNPFNLHKKEIKKQKYNALKTVQGYITDADLSSEIKVAVNGKIVDESEYKTTYLADGDNIVICPVIGKGGGKNVLGMIAAIALSVVSMGVGSAVTGGAMFGAGSVAMTSWTFAGYLAAAAVMYVGGTLMQNLSGSVNVDNSNDYQQSQTYSWNTAQTHISQGSPIPLTFGRVKITNNNVLSAHVVSDGDKQYLNLLISSGEGEIDSISDIKIQNNPIANYNDVICETRLGTNDQKPISIPSFADSISDMSLSYELTTDDWKAQLIEGNSTQGIELTIEFPSGLYYANDQGGLSETGINICIQYRVAGSEAWTTFKDNERITGASSSNVRKVYRIDNLQVGQYEVRCKLSSKDATTSRYANRTMWTQVSSIIPDKFAYPNMVLVALKALATSQLSSSSPAVTWMQERKNVWVFNPYTSKYEQKPATNPAWACYDILHLCRRIKDIHTGNYVYDVQGCPANLIMYDDFSAWASECDRRGLVCNFFLDASGDLDNACKSLESAGRGKVVRRGTKYGCVYDHVSQPVQMFSVGNIDMSSFSLDYLPSNERANAVEITFNNEQKDYQRDTMIIYSDDYDTADGVANATQITLDAITDPKTIFREGKYYLRKNQHLIRTITFQANVDAISCQTGDVILVQHDVPQWGAGGRIVSVVDKQLKLDRPVKLDKEKVYEISIRLQNDNIVQYKLINTGTETDTVTIDTADKIDINVNDVYSFGEQYISVKPFTVISITRTSDTMMTLECLEYNEAVYSESTSIPEIDYTLTHSVDITELTLTQQLVNTVNSISNILNVTWKTAYNRCCAYYDIYLSINNAPESKIASTEKTSYVVNNIVNDYSYTVIIIPRNDDGSVAGKSMSRTVQSSYNIEPPATPTNFALKQSGQTFKASWDVINNIDYYELRLDSNAGNSAGLLLRTQSNNVNVTLPTRTGTLYLFAHNTAGKYSNPITCNWSVQAPIAPTTDLIITVLLGNVTVKSNAPNGMCIKVVNSSNVEKLYNTAENSYTFPLDPDIYEISVAYCDAWGIGAWSSTRTITVKATFNPEWIADQSISLEKVDSTVKSAIDEANTKIPALNQSIAELKTTTDAITSTVASNKKNQDETNTTMVSQIKQQSDSITSVVNNLNSNNCTYTALTQLSDGLNLRVAKDDIINQINMTAQGTTIDGKYLHVTGTTQFDDNVIVNRMIQAHAISADKLNVSSLSAVSAKIGTLKTADSGARVEISDNLIQVFDANNRLRVKMGVW